MQSLTEHSIPDKDTNLRDTIMPYLRYWPWFILSVIILLGAAHIYLRYTPLSYQTTASILIKDDSNSGHSQMAMFQDLGMGQFNTANLDNEIKVLKSRPLTERMVKQLNLNIRYFSEGRILDNEIYGNVPIKLEVLTPEGEWKDGLPSLFVTPISLTEFTIGHEEEAPQKFQFGESCYYKGVEYILHSNLIENATLNKMIRVDINSVRRTTDTYRNNFVITPEGRQGSIINIQLISSTPDKSKAVIDELIHQFNRDAIEDKNLVSKNTAAFIDERLHIIWKELDSVETGKVSYKEEHRLVDLQQQGSIFLENASEYNQRLLEVQTELSQINAMIRYLDMDNYSSLLPANLGVADGGLIALIQQYNQLVVERNQLLANATDSHPTIVRLTKQLVEMKTNVLQSLENLKETLEIRLSSLKEQERFIGSQLAGIPIKEKDFTNIERQQEIKQTLYLYLLQKREETSIALAVTEPKAKIVDTAYTPMRPIAPKKSTIYLASLILGVLIPFSAIYGGKMLDNKVRKSSDLSDVIPNATILGEIPRIGSNNALVERNDLGMVAESFRVLRSNMQFAGLLDENEAGKILMVTSSIKGEGKTTVSSNLALTLSYTGLKVLLVGADIRNPKLLSLFHSGTKPKGLVNYLMDEEKSLNDYILASGVSDSLDILHSGSIPPNPEEFMMKEKMNTFLEEAKKIYDFIILDTAPTLLVTDTLLLSKKVDATLYVVRAGHTEKEILKFAKSLKEEGKLNNVNYILNNLSQANYGYGGKYGYGYGYSNDKTSTWEKIKGIFS